MLVGLRGMVQGIFHFWDEHISADGGWWILAFDSVLLIPLIFAGFFYPISVLILVGAVAVLTLGVIVIVRIVRDVRNVRVVPVLNVRTSNENDPNDPNVPNDPND